jgi:hypothetical protein
LRVELHVQQMFEDLLGKPLIHGARKAVQDTRADGLERPVEGHHDGHAGDERGQRGIGHGRYDTVVDLHGEQRDGDAEQVDQAGGDHDFPHPSAFPEQFLPDQSSCQIARQRWRRAEAARPSCEGEAGRLIHSTSAPSSSAP